MRELIAWNSAVLTMTFTDETGALVTPSGGRYAVTDADSETVLLPWTAFTPGASTFNISIPAEINRILDINHDQEIREVSVVLYYGLGNQASGAYQYSINAADTIPPHLNVVGSGGAVISGIASITANGLVIQ